MCWIVGLVYFKLSKVHIYILIKEQIWFGFIFKNNESLIHHKFCFFGDEILKSNDLLMPKIEHTSATFLLVSKYKGTAVVHQVLAQCWFCMPKKTQYLNFFFCKNRPQKNPSNRTQSNVYFLNLLLQQAILSATQDVNLPQKFNIAQLDLISKTTTTYEKRSTQRENLVWCSGCAPYWCHTGISKAQNVQNNFKIMKMHMHNMS